MAEEGTFTTNAEVLRKSGLMASGSWSGEAYTNQFIKEVEGELCAAARYDFVANYSSLNTRGKEFLRLAASSGAAIPVISYTMKFITVDTSRAEAEDRVNILRDFYTRCLGILIDKKNVDFIVNGNTST